ncbi:hypothetical protein ARMGADRAFT_1021049 [Armillaria gallica]|uniref:ZZ-type domain-containing protein n=1 Tax=Armillaria gallica TaxID=47427 RepID=A0A2H3CAS8_ARMGA|nr:hypothetical protein ARMGADRAFT_1021049 [Armillaria gallica]
MSPKTRSILATAAAALERGESIQSKEPGKLEKRMNWATDEYNDATSGPFIAVVDAAISSGVCNVIQSELSGWVEASTLLVQALEELQKIHPFISVAVSPFKVALQLESKRRENDEKISALFMLMKEMMDTLRMLPEDPNLLKNNQKDSLTGLMHRFCQDIIDCANACNAYRTRSIWSRILMSTADEQKLAAYGDRFQKNKQDLQLCLIVRINAELNEVKELVSVIMLINLVRSPQERELKELIDKEGGASKVKDDPALLEKIIKETEKNSNRRGTYQDDKNVKTLVSSIQAEIRHGFEDLIKTHKTVFDLKFEAQGKLIDDVGQNVTRTGDRVISAVISGPYERLKDPDLFEMWKEMHSRWGGNAKARDFIFALRAHYYSRTQSTLEQTQQMTSTENDSDGTSHVTTDTWALRHITLRSIEPLMEAFDEDASGFVTIDEANNFSTRRPKDWSMPHWVAYWAVGFQMTLVHYHEKISTLLEEMHTAAEQTLPANRVFMDLFLSAHPLCRVDVLLSGFKNTSRGGYWSDWSKFLPYVQAEEERLKGQLEALKYNIDASDSLLLITGPGRLERFIFPLIYLLFKRQYLIIDYCRSTVIHPDILWSNLRSVRVIMNAVDIRVNDLQAVFKHKNRDEAVMFSKSVYGLFSSWISNSWHYNKSTPVELISELPLTDLTSPDFTNLEPILRENIGSDTIDEDPEGMDPSYVSHQDFVDFFIHYECHAEWSPYVSMVRVGSYALFMAMSLVDTLDPKRIQFYRSLAWFKARRQIVHGGVTCDICHEYLIGSRFLCLDCLREYDDDSTDFCIQHFREYFVRKAPKCEVVHTRYHPLLQLRRCLATRRLFSVADSSRAALEAAKESLADPSGHPECANCKQNVMPPCWFCVDCEDEFFLCFECNAKDNATEPWITDKHLHREEGHTYVHKLVLCPESKPDEPKAFSVEERLEATEKHMETMGKHMEATKMNMEKHVQAMEKRMEETGKHIKASEKRIEVMEKHIEETKNHMEASQRSLQDLLEFQKKNSSARIERLLTWGAGLIVIFAIWAIMMRG